MGSYPKINQRGCLGNGNIKHNGGASE